MIKAYYTLTKPGIIYGNILTTIAGFLLAAKGHYNWWLLIATVVGTSLVIGSACAFNNYLDRNIDKKMARTKNRALVRGDISPRHALAFAAVLGLVGFVTLASLTNWAVVVVGIVGFIDYVVLYGLSKRRSVHGTLVGSISGATPVVAGYVAVIGHFDLGALLLFLIMAAWQMPHFYAIAMYRADDYRAAGIPVLPVKASGRSVKVHIALYIVLFIVANGLLAIFGYAGWSYLAIMTMAGAYWLWWGLRGFRAHSNTPWARKLFFVSLIVLLVFSVMLAVGSILP